MKEYFNMNNSLYDKISKVMELNFPEVFKSLNDNANDNDLEKLNLICFNGKGVPHELIELYKWHNGQTGSYSLNQDDNFTFLSINDVIDSYEFLNNPNEDILMPYKNTWIPLFYNGSGDYLMYVIQGDDKSKIINYWHDDPKRVVKYPSLEYLLLDVLKFADNSN